MTPSKINNFLNRNISHPNFCAASMLFERWRMLNRSYKLMEGRVHLQGFNLKEKYEAREAASTLAVEAGVQWAKLAEALETMGFQRTNAGVKYTTFQN